MLKKLFRYDFLWLMKTMPYFYLAVLASMGLTLLTNHMNDAHPGVMAWLICDKVVSALFIFACFAAAIITVVRIFMRFRRNFYQDESYLTHTLPVSKKVLFGSKVLASFTVEVITILVIAACIAITMAGAADTAWLKEVFTADNALLCIVFLEEVLLLILCLFAGTVIGNRSEKHKTLIGVIMGILIYFAVAQVVGIGIGITFFANSSVRLLFQESPDIEAAKEALKLVSGVCALTYAIGNAAVYLLTAKLFQKGVNVE